MTPIRRRLTYANVMATLAFFVAIGGTTLAPTKIDGATIEKGTIPGKAIKNTTIKAKKVKADTLTGGQIQEGTLGKVPSATVADSATSAGHAQTLGGQSAAQLTDSCPVDTTPYAGVCIETATRPVSTWPTAAKTCGDAGGRLAALEELEAYRRQPGVTLANGELTSSYLDANNIASAGELAVVISDTGLPRSNLDYDESFAPYRCVFPLTNSR